MSAVHGAPTERPAPEPGDEVAWVRQYLGHVCADEVRAAGRHRGTQAAADRALGELDLRGYAARRNEVWPSSRRGATGLSPWIRHGLLTLPRVWRHASGPSPDVTKFHDELLWQEYARHLYARLGTAMAEPMQHRPMAAQPLSVDEGWSRDSACLDLVMGELESDGWIVNQTRMWLAAHWTIREGGDWRDGEDHFFTHLLDGSRAANRAGWQWTAGLATGRPYGFSRAQVERRAPGVCGGCERRDHCPIEAWPETPELVELERNALLRHDPDLQRTTGPTSPQAIAVPEVVWLTAESLGDDDPALRKHPDLPVVFVFDEPLLTTLRLSGKRLVFLAERLAELASERTLLVHVGDPVEVLRDVAAATTFAPVPGWRQRAAAIDPVAVYPWPWLRRPVAGSIGSFSAWRRSIERA